jgi:hypothetical protein
MVRFASSELFAGMPALRLTEIAAMRLETISFFVVALLLCALCVQGIWNFLRRDFKSMPRLGYPQALGIVLLWGMLFLLVLTMISGARELMTPGAWEKDGLTYRLKGAASVPAAPPGLEHELERRSKLEALRTVLWQYASKHDGHFPAAAEAAAGDCWLVPGPSGLRYHYIPDLVADRGASPLAYEPGVFGDPRLVLSTDGSIKPLPLSELLAALQPVP